MQRVLVVDNQSLLGAGIESLLMEQDDLEVTGVSPDNASQLLQAVKLHEPDVIILTDACDSWQLNALVAYLDCHTEVRIIGVNSEDNSAFILDKRRQPVIQLPDFFNFIRS